jgi:F420 biosynthesis protein FbiB-like protein
MQTIDAIAQRRSIRKYKGTPVTDEQIHAILLAATQAPSGKNRQPWRFIVVSGDKRTGILDAMRAGMAKHEARGEDTGSAKWTVQIMEQAPVTIFIFNPEGMHPWLTRSIDQAFGDLVNLQSVGAAIQNMCLAALDLGLGSLWIADVLYAYDELCAYLGQDCQMVAALAIGYPDEEPGARPRKPVDEVARWI